MGQSSNVAQKCFVENINLFASPHSEPEKFNLYTGLANIADAISDLESQIYSLRQEVGYLRQELRRK